MGEKEFLGEMANIIIEFIDGATGIRARKLKKLERFSDPDVLHMEKATGEERIDLFVSYLSEQEKEVLKLFIDEFNKECGGVK